MEIKEVNVRQEIAREVEKVRWDAENENKAPVIVIDRIIKTIRGGKDEPDNS